MKAVAYIRVSTERQAQNNLSLEGQEKQIREYCKSLGVELVQLFSDAGESAKTADRPQLLQSLEFCRKNRDIDLYVVWKLDRLSRNADDHSTIRVMLSKIGVVIRSVTEAIDESPTGNLMSTILSGFAQFDNELRSLRSTEGVKRRIEQGGWPHAAPLGFTNIRDELGRPTVKINQTGLVIADLMREFIRGGMSVQDIHNKIDEYGIKSPRSNKRVGYQTVVNMLRNPLYAGMVYSKSIDEPIEGLHQGIITKSEYNSIQMILDGRSQKVEVANVAEWPLRGGFIKCHHCGNSLTGSSPTGRSKSYPMYHCTRCSARKLGHKVSVSRDDLHLQFVQLLEDIRPSDVHVKLFREVFLKRWNDVHSSQMNEQARLTQLLFDLRARKARVIDLFVDGSLTREEKEDRTAQIDSDILKYELAVTDNADDVTAAEAVIDFGTELMHNAPNLWRSANLKNRQQLQRAIFPNGLTYSFVSGFGTAETSELYEVMRQFDSVGSNLVGLDGIEPSTKWL